MRRSVVPAYACVESAKHRTPSLRPSAGRAGRTPVLVPCPWFSQQGAILPAAPTAAAAAPAAPAAPAPTAPAMPAPPVPTQWLSCLLRFADLSGPVRVLEGGCCCNLLR